MSLALKPYPAYKDSGVTWFGDIPTDWEMKRLGSILQERGETNDKCLVKEILSVLRNVGVIPYAEKGNVGNKCSEDITRYKVVRVGDIVVNSMNVIIGSVGLSRYTGCLSPVYYVLRTRENDELPEYYDYVFQMRSFQQSLTRLGNGILSHRMRIPMEKLKCEPIPKPEIAEQRKIVEFLKVVDNRIRRYIRAKRRLIELLNEEKQAIINRAVTRGLDPHVRLKLSGIEWLREVPEHWDEISIRQLAELLQTGPFGSQLHANEYVSHGIPVINPSHLIDGRLVPNVDCAVTIATAKRLCKHKFEIDDIVIARRGELGRCGLVQEHEVGWLCGTGSVLLRPKKGVIENRYLLLVISSKSVKEYLSLHSIGATMANLNTSIIGQIRIPLPSISEQLQIIEHISQQSIRVDEVIHRTSSEIALIREYRTRLIADVVTGKLDVRGVELPEAVALAEIDDSVDNCEQVFEDDPSPESEEIGEEEG